jgi:hypothetical protein
MSFRRMSASASRLSRESPLRRTLQRGFATLGKTAAERVRLLPGRAWTRSVSTCQKVQEQLSSFNARRPLIANMITAGTLFCVGDVLCQGIEHWRKPDAEKAAAGAKPFEMDYPRLARMTAFGVGVLGPVGHHWCACLVLPRSNVLCASCSARLRSSICRYRYLDRILPGTSTSEIVRKVFYDEVSARFLGWSLSWLASVSASCAHRFSFHARTVLTSAQRNLLL